MGVLVKLCCIVKQLLEVVLIILELSGGKLRF